MYIILSTLCVLASRVLSQNVPIDTSENILNPGQIYYFEDQRSQLSVLPITKTYNDEQRRKFADSRQNTYLSGYFSNIKPGVTPTQSLDFNENVRTRTQQSSLIFQRPTFNEKKFNNDELINYGGSSKEVDPMEEAPPPPAIKIGPLSRPITNFGLNLVKRIQKSGQNLVLSPFSIATILALLQQGSTGVTQQQITAALQMAPEAASVSYKNLTSDIRSRSGQNILNVATNIYLADAFQISPAFKSVAINNFNSEITPSNFAFPEKAVQIINNWIATKTNNKIQNLLTSDSIGVNTQAVLVNAVYFKAPWAMRFHPDVTFTGKFTLSNGAQQTVSYMKTRKHFRTGVDRYNIAEIIVLPFEQEQYSLMVILPSEVSSIAAVLPTLTDAKLLEYHQFPYQETYLEIPKFTVRGDTDLNVALRQLGIVNMFGSSSELAGLGTYKNLSPQISSAVHSAVLTVDEDGGSAVAATAFAVVALSYHDPTVVFKVKRPFIAVLWDSSSGVPLFMATIENPVV